MLKRFFNIADSGGVNGQADASGHIALASALVLAGIAIVSPGIKDALVSFLNKQFDLGLSPDTPWYVGLLLIGLGVMVYCYGEYGIRRSRELSTATPPGTFAALRHQSFEPLAGQLPTDAVPARLGRRTVCHVECDQSAFFSSGAADPAGAVRQQARMVSDLAAACRTDPDAAVGYYGIVHVPLQFLAGCLVSTWREVVLFELGRNDQRWHELEQGNGPDLGLGVQTLNRPAHPSAIVIRIAISYNVPVADVADVVPSPFEDIRIAITPPHLDAITHYGQVEAICAAFRRILDEVHSRVDKSKTIHVLYAGPVSLGFSLGRRISRTIHHRVIVYNYSARAMPRYAWGVEVNDDTTATPAVVRPTSLGAAVHPAGNS